MEKSIFSRKRWIESKMPACGFHKEGKIYVLKKTFFNGDFLAILSVDATGQLTSRVIDTMTQDDYDALYQKNAHGTYVNMVRAAYTQLLEDIAASCCRDVLFASKGDPPYQSYGAFRHTSNRKWFALIMNVKRTVLDKDSDPDLIDILNLKIHPEEADSLHAVPGIYPAYHMNHRLWISIVLDDTLPDEKIMNLIRTSYQLIR